MAATTWKKLKVIFFKKQHWKHDEHIMIKVWTMENVVSVPLICHESWCDHGRSWHGSDDFPTGGTNGNIFFNFSAKFIPKHNFFKRQNHLHSVSILNLTGGTDSGHSLLFIILFCERTDCHWINSISTELAFWFNLPNSSSSNCRTRQNPKKVFVVPPFAYSRKLSGIQTRKVSVIPPYANSPKVSEGNHLHLYF